MPGGRSIGYLQVVANEHAPAARPSAIGIPHWNHRHSWRG